mgnify:FL=1
MRINKNAPITDIIGSHERRISTLELIFSIFALISCFKLFSKVLADNSHNLSQGI